MTGARRGLFALRIAVLFHLTLHAFLNPVYEGPDEPFHLARARAVADRPLAEALRGEGMDGRLVRSLQAWPCAAPLHAGFGCPPFGSEPATFNIVTPARSAGAARPVANYEAHQPPLYYLAAGSLLALFAPPATISPEIALLLLRLTSVLLVGVALFLPVRKLGQEHELFESILLLVLLLPGSAESLARVANDAAVFAWAAVLVWAVSRQEELKPSLTAFLAAVGPLLKLTALPVVAVAAVVGWRTRGWRIGLLVAASGLAVFPLQSARGWAWGGTVEANTQSPMLEPTQAILVGLAHSACTLFKTSIWLGGWTSFRPPGVVLIAVPLFVAVLYLRAFRLRSRIERREAHAAGLVVACAGFLAFAIGNRQLFGVWGAVAGWYVWGWAPWLALLVADSIELRPHRYRDLMIAGLLGVALLNLLWFEAAFRIYG